MNDVIENLIERVALLPKAAQDEIVQAVLDIEARHGGVYRLSDEERVDIAEALEEVRCGIAASPDEVAEVFARLKA